MPAPPPLPGLGPSACSSCPSPHPSQVSSYEPLSGTLVLAEAAHYGWRGSDVTLTAQIPASGPGIARGPRLGAGDPVPLDLSWLQYGALAPWDIPHSGRVGSPLCCCCCCRRWVQPAQHRAGAGLAGARLRATPPHSRACLLARLWLVGWAGVPRPAAMPRRPRPTCHRATTPCGPRRHSCSEAHARAWDLHHRHDSVQLLPVTANPAARNLCCRCPLPLCALTCRRPAPHTPVPPSAPRPPPPAVLDQGIQPPLPAGPQQQGSGGNDDDAWVLPVAIAVPIGCAILLAAVVMVLLRRRRRHRRGAKAQGKAGAGAGVGTDALQCSSGGVNTTTTSTCMTMGLQHPTSPCTDVPGGAQGQGCKASPRAGHAGSKAPKGAAGLRGGPEAISLVLAPDAKPPQRQGCGDGSSADAGAGSGTAAGIAATSSGVPSSFPSSLENGTTGSSSGGGTVPAPSGSAPCCSSQDQASAAALALALQQQSALALLLLEGGADAAGVQEAEVEHALQVRAPGAVGFAYRPACRVGHRFRFDDAWFQPGWVRGRAQETGCAGPR